MTHFPVGLLLAGAAFDLGAVVFRKDEWRVVGFWMLVAAVVMAVPSIVAGLMTASVLFGGPASPPDIVLHHRAAAFTTVAFAIAALAWRVLKRDRMKGAARYGALALSLAAAASVGYAGYLGGHMVLGSESQASDRGSLTAGTEEARDDALAPRDEPKPELVARGLQLFQSGATGCRNCHTYQGRGGRIGPDLTDVGREHPDMKWHIEHLKDPRKVRPGSTMPSFDRLPEGDLKALAAFLATRR